MEQCYSTEITCPRSLVYKCLNWDLTTVYIDGKITLRTIQVLFVGSACKTQQIPLEDSCVFDVPQ